MFNGRRQPSCDGTSRMTRECQVRICERLGVKFPGPTRQVIDDTRFRRSPYRGDSGRSQPFWPRARQRNCTSIHHHVLHGLSGKLS
jgi:hypothetical protein